MTSSVATPEIVRIKRLELAFTPRPWPFAEARRDEIDRHFAQIRQAKPAVWNGRILLLYQYAIVDGVFRGAYFETDYASFVAWRAWGFPDPAVRNCFSLGALRGSDGGFLLGVMNSHTLNAGKIYFPAGTPEPNDINGEMVDLASSIHREVAEETGIAPEDYDEEAGWTCVFSDAHIAQIKQLGARETAAALRARILANLAREREPEFADIRIARGPADLDPMMPPFVSAFLTHVWSQPRESRETDQAVQDR
jgi:8-oxo-dGTP pyrophosphatase MutT (NUDIX family)